MDHTEAKTKLNEFYDGELPQKEASSFSDHLASCEECRTNLDQLREISQMVHRELEVQVSSRFSDSIMERILGNEVSFHGWFGLPKWEVAVAFSVSFFIFSYFFLHYLEPSKNGVEKEWVFSKAQIETEDVLQIALGAERSDEVGMEELLND